MKYLGPYIIEDEFIAPKISVEKAIEIGDSIGVDWDEVDPKQLAMGIGVELEHGSMFHPETDVIGTDLKKAAKIAWAHLKEVPDYYTKLSTIEEKYKDQYGRPSAAKRGYGHAWRKKREEIIERDKSKCTKCGKAVSGKGNRQVDHKTNRKRKSGSDAKSNLRLLCGPCHRAKTAKYDRK